ncbi:hypothetical protein SHKM778_48620 [Streptomyces sp. KM77-8]|uniref:TerD domain-containing protein n=1 Tax=Streptomyces haneummycinicus TaxID=3074435 RepID=A0AAT9HME1_9ACTN
MGGFVREMIKGANATLTDLSDDVGSVIVSLGWGSPTGEGDADVSVLLLNTSGKVRSDEDFYFYNHPVAADGSVQLLGKTPTADGSEDRISFDLAAVPSDIDRIVITASRYDGARFGELENVGITLADAAGESLLRFAVDDAGSVTAVIFGELYRRAEGWKFRAVGQGYESGLAGLATDFGVDIEDDAASKADTQAGLDTAEAYEQTNATTPVPAPPVTLAAVPALANRRTTPSSRRSRPGVHGPPRRRSRFPGRSRRPWRRTTPGSRRGSSRSPYSRATGTARRVPPRCCCR